MFKRRPNKNRKVEMIACDCGCGGILNKYDERNRPRTSFRYHLIKTRKPHNKGKPMPAHVKKALREANVNREPWNKNTKGKMPVPWNKGMSGKYKLPATSEKMKGRRNSPGTEFKKGQIPWNKGLMGKENPMWKENKVTPLKRWLRGTEKYKIWQKSIFERDDYTCQLCSKRGGRLNIDHHPKTFNEIISLYSPKEYEDAFEIRALWDTSNGRVLCEECHRATSTWGKPEGGK